MPAKKRLTARFVETVATDQPRADYRDATVNGLEFRVTKNGVRTFAFRYRRQSDRKQRRVTLGHLLPSFGLAEARQKAEELRVSVSKGADPASGIQERKAAPTFAEVAMEWQAKHAALNRSERVRTDDQSMLDRYVLPTIGTLKMHDVGRREISGMLTAVCSAADGRNGHLRDGHSRRLTHRPNRVFELTRAIVRWAVAQGIIASDPTLGMKRPIKKEAPRERELSHTEIAQFWHGLDKLAMTPGLRVALQLALATGQRIGEVTGMRKSEIALNSPGPVWIVPRERTKNGEGNRVPLSNLAVSLVMDAWLLAGDSPWLFPSRNKDGHVAGHAATVAIFRGREILGLSNFRVHDLRRTAATQMGEMGINPHTISLILNHVSASKSTITSRAYNQYQYDREKREALDAWGARLERIIADGSPALIHPQRTDPRALLASNEHEHRLE